MDPNEFGAYESETPWGITPPVSSHWRLLDRLALDGLGVVARRVIAGEPSPNLGLVVGPDGSEWIAEFPARGRSIEREHEELSAAAAGGARAVCWVRILGPAAAERRRAEATAEDPDRVARWGSGFLWTPSERAIEVPHRLPVGALWLPIFAADDGRARRRRGA